MSFLRACHGIVRVGNSTILKSTIKQSSDGLPVQCRQSSNRSFATAPAVRAVDDDQNEIQPVPQSTYSNALTVRPWESTSLSKEDAEIWSEIKRIATATPLESPRLYGSFGVGQPLVGELAPIRPREVRWEPMLNATDSFWYRETSARKGRPSVSAITFMQRKRDFTLRGLRLWLKRIDLARLRKDQTYNPERVQTLGADLAAAHFLVYRGARVKFHDVEKWYSIKERTADSLPDRFIPSARLEAIDAEGLPLLYEGMDHLIGLRFLKFLSLKNCPRLDDWCIPKLYILSSSLEHLDLSGCPKISERGLSCLYHLRNLRTLVLDNLPKVENKEYISLLLQDELPLLDVEGVEYNQPPPVYLSPVEQRALEEQEWAKKRIPFYDRVALPEVVEVGNKQYQLAHEEELRKRALPKVKEE